MKELGSENLSFILALNQYTDNDINDNSGFSVQGATMRESFVCELISTERGSRHKGYQVTVLD